MPGPRQSCSATLPIKIATAGDFFGLMRRSGATLRLVAGESDTSFDPEAVARAAERATTTTVEDAEEVVEGQLGGVLPDAHQFEFRTLGSRGTFRGKVDRAIPPTELANYNRRWVNIDAMARLQVKRILHQGRIVRESFTLLGLDAANQPPMAAG
jgi:hypothetical protein